MTAVAARPTNSESSHQQPYMDEANEYEEDERRRLAEVNAIMGVLDVEMKNFESNIITALTHFNQRLRRKQGLLNIRDRIHAALKIPLITTADTPKGMVSYADLEKAMGDEDSAAELVKRLELLRTARS